METGICSQLAKLDDTVSSFLLWGYFSYDTEILASYYHQQVLQLPASSQYNLYCNPDDRIELSFQDFITYAGDNQPLTDQTNKPFTLVVRNLEVLTYREQYKLLRILLSRLDGKLKKFRFVLTSERGPSDLLTELLKYFNNYTYHCPPLDQRKNDVIPLANFFIESLCAEKDILQPAISLDIEGYLRSRSWINSTLDLYQEIETLISIYLSSKSKKSTLNKELIDENSSAVVT